jgi:hypothetical protein
VLPSIRSLTPLLAAALVACTGMSEPTCVWCEPASEELVSIQNTSWLVVDVAIPPASPRDLNGDTFAAGFDLDRFDSGQGLERDGSCDRMQPDHRSSLDRDLGGVDNALQSLIPTANSVHMPPGSVEEDLLGATRELRIRWALRVGALEEDEEGNASLPIEWVAIDPAAEIAVDLEGMPAAGQELEGTVIASTVAYVRRTDAWGRGFVQGLPVGGSEIPFLPFGEFWLAAFGIDARLASEGVLHGNLGGSFAVQALVDAVVRHVTLYVDEPETVAGVARDVIEMAADLEPRAEAPASCARVSAGFTFQAVPLTLHAE